MKKKLGNMSPCNEANRGHVDPISPLNSMSGLTLYQMRSNIFGVTNRARKTASDGTGEGSSSNVVMPGVGYSSS